ncbi:hypothetical protein BJ978_002679 [Agromyces terreus]|uniref:Uncharacterized protein n=1 Tax=Agromyces terreus TaxID=424795 RepID=A0A9X2H3N6_9MICO|nr:hypothetical protein [Agromyces terreus]MCP2372003.1 hypothetical protein [Agromyces terreus]
MTSSQEPQLTRREMRERERLQEQAASPTPNPAPTGATPLPPAAPRSTPQPAPVPAYSAPATGSTANGAARAPQPSAPYGQQPTPYPTAAPLPPVSATPASSFAPAPAVPVRPAPVPPVSAAPAPAAPAQPSPGPADQAPVASTPERTLTRRELRAMLGSAATDADIDDLDDVDDEIAGATAMEAPRAPAASSPAPVPSAPASPAAAAPSVAASAPAPAPRQPIQHQESAASVAEQPAAASKPVGHWTSQLDAPVEPQPYDQMLSRGGVGRGVPTTTNALILPTLPDHAGIPAPLADNGEIIVTGSIDLPRSFGATGVHPSQIDSSDVDRLFDQVEDGATAGAPVSATRAISTQSAAKAVMTPPSKEGMNVPLVLAVTAGVLALGVVATLVIGALTGLF